MRTFVSVWFAAALFAQSPDAPLVFTNLAPKVTSEVLATYTVQQVCTGLNDQSNGWRTCNSSVSGDPELWSIAFDYMKNEASTDANGNLYYWRATRPQPPDFPTSYLWELTLVDPTFRTKTRIANIEAAVRCTASGNTATRVAKGFINGQFPYGFYNGGAKAYYIATLTRVTTYSLLSGAQAVCLPNNQTIPPGNDRTFTDIETVAIVRANITPPAMK